MTSEELAPTAHEIAIEVLVHGPQSRAQLARKLGVSAPSVTRLVKPLLDRGILVESDLVRSPGPGRSSVALDVVADREQFIGVKLTSDALYGVVTNARAEVLASRTSSAPSLAVADILTAASDLVGSLAAQATAPVRAVGVTVGGKVDGGEEVANSPFLHWHDVPFRTLLGERIPYPLYLANDVVGLTKAQQWFGYGRTFPDFALLTVGAGVGYGLVVNDAVVPTQVSPVSHLPVDSGGPLCSRGHRGCLTSLVTSGAVAAAVATALERPVTFEEVLELAQVEHPVALRAVSDAAWAVGRAVSMITSLTGVDRVILSGEGVAIAEIGRTALRRGQLAFAGNAEKAPEPVIRHMDFHEWARGAAVIAIQASFP